MTAAGESRLSGPDGSGGPHVFVDDLGSPLLSDVDHHHLAKALRTRDGDPITVSNGAGQWRACRFGPNVEPTGEILSVAEPAYEVGVAFVLVKGARPELATQKLTELGVDHITLLHGDHSVVRWEGAKVTKNIERLDRIAREASMQSRRVRLPTISGMQTIHDLVGSSAGVAIAEPGGRNFDGSERLVVIGPEGGWSPGELALAQDAGESGRSGLVSLGSQILRAETAAIVAGTLLGHLRDGTLSPPLSPLLSPQMSPPKAKDQPR